MPRKKVFTTQEFLSLLDTASNVKTVCAILTVASDQVQNGDMSPYAFAGVLRECSSKIYSISNH